MRARRLEVVEDEPAGLQAPGTCGASGRAASSNEGPRARPPTARVARRTGRGGRRGSRRHRSPGRADRARRPHRASIEPRPSRPTAIAGSACSSSWSRSSSPSRSGSPPPSSSLMLGIMLKVGALDRGRGSLGPACHQPERAVPVRVPVRRLGARLRDRPAARPARRRRLALRRARPDRPVHRLLHHDGLALGGHRRVAAVTARPRRAPRRRRSATIATVAIDGGPDARISEHIATWQSARSDRRRDCRAGSGRHGPLRTRPTLRHVAAARRHGIR